MFSEDYKSDRDEKTEWVRPFYRSISFLNTKFGIGITVLVTTLILFLVLTTNYSTPLLIIVWYAVIHAVTLIWTRETVPATIYDYPLPHHTTLIVSFLSSLILGFVYILIGVGMIYTISLILLGWISTRKFYFMVRSDKWNYSIDPPITLLYLLVVLPYRTWFFATFIALFSTFSIDTTITLAVTVLSILVPLSYSLLRTIITIPRQETQADDKDFQEAMTEFKKLYDQLQKIESRYNNITDRDTQITYNKIDLDSKQLKTIQIKLKKLNTKSIKDTHPIHDNISDAIEQIQYIQDNYKINTSDESIVKK